jgi:hypothetical protein
MTPRPKFRNTTSVPSTRNEDNSFTVIHPTQLEFQGAPPQGSLNDVQCVRTALAESIRGCGKSRAQIAEEMTYLSNRKVTERMINGYTAESQEDYQFPADLTRAFCVATSDMRLLKCMAELQGLRVVNADEAELIELGRAFLQRTEAEEQIALLQKRLQGRSVL